MNKRDLLLKLREKNIDFQVHEHKPLYTVEDSEKLRGKIEGSHTKNLFLKNKKNDFFLFSCDEKAKIDLKKFSKSIDAKNLSFANEGYMDKYLGIKPGSVSPYALLNDKGNNVIFYLDENLEKSEKINYHPLINDTTITTKTKDFINFILENKKRINIFSIESYTKIKTL